MHPFNEVALSVTRRDSALGAHNCFAVDFQKLFKMALRRKPFFRRENRIRSHLACVRCPETHSAQAFGQRLRISRRKKQTGVTVLDEFGQPTYPARDNRRTQGQRFHPRERKVFIALRRHDRAQRLGDEASLDLSCHMADELDVVHPRLADCPAQIDVERPGSGNLERQFGH